MVEGGPTVARAFLVADLIDEVVIAQGTKALGAGGRLPLVDRGIDIFADECRWDAVENRAIGPDRIKAYRRRDRFAAGQDK
jgi:riboflavin biosynthesis pyrimidine reductase